MAAFVTDRPLMGVSRVYLRRPESLGDVNIVLGPDPSTDALVSLADNRWVMAMRENTKAEREAKRPPAGNRGQPAPELDGVAWYNTDARNLKDFRGRYVLLDFWFTGCSPPCHYDFPSVKLTDGPPLRVFKLQVIRRYLLHAADSP